MPGASFEQAFNAGVRIDVGGSGDAYVDGLNKLKPYGITNTVNDVNQFRIGITSKYTSVGDLGTISYGGNDLGDDAGQAYLKAAALAKTEITTTRFYKNLTDFFMPDLANDPNSSIQISKHDVDETDQNGIYSFTGEAVFNGAPATFTKHKTATTMAIAADAGGDTIDDSAATFVTDGFAVGQTIILEGVTASADDYTQHLITAVTEIQIVTDSINTLTVQATGSEFTIHGGKF